MKFKLTCIILLFTFFLSKAQDYEIKDKTKYYIKTDNFDNVSQYSMEYYFNDAIFKKVAKSLKISKSEAEEVIKNCRSSYRPVKNWNTFGYVMYKVCDFIVPLESKYFYKEEMWLMYVANDANTHLESKYLSTNGKGFFVMGKPENISLSLNPNTNYQSINNTVSSTTNNNSYTKPKKDPALTNSILADRAKTSAWGWKTRYFNPEYKGLPLRLKPPFTKDMYKELGSHYGARVSPDGLKNIVEQCAFENWPTFYKQHSNPSQLFVGPFRNLIVEEVVTFKNKQKSNEYELNDVYTIIYISDKLNAHAPKELLSDDGLGFFMCVPAAVLQEGKSNTYTYNNFTLDDFGKKRSFQNWTTKRRVYVQDMNYIDESFDVSLKATDMEIKNELNINDQELAQLKEWCNIKYRPDDLNTAQKVKDAQRNAKFLDVVVYNLLGSNIGNILYMPAKENMHLPIGMRPKNNDGWYFTSRTNIDLKEPSTTYKNSILATTDASMEKYSKEQAAREKQMKMDAEKLADWRLNNELKGSMIYQYSFWNSQLNREDFTYKVVTIFGPPDQDITKEDEINMDKLVGGQPKAIVYKEDYDDVESEQYITKQTGSHRFSVNTGYNYTIPKRYASSSTNTPSYKQADDAVKEAQKKVDAAMKDLLDGKSLDRTELIQKSTTDIFRGMNFIEKDTEVTVIDVPSSDKFYNENKKYIGKTGTVEMLTENGDGTHYGMIKFAGEKNATVFYKVKININK
ncbi:MAG TPA: hypothetical protein PKK18_12350 [Chitinophagales bacterium]|jgi:hypothetical protein|nr:hypothetical protein [Chitinophagales bacterium]HMW13100.1 hypothetical protein [Chitinophagales bacterium]HMX61055.1 hypothetical protein [Chitinophagales bacterium]HNA39449.1 hypothetical protein [Chitinophagales bacterium]HNC71750.1 hypothetical protein [Chitinophagales bacterium]